MKVLLLSPLPPPVGGIASWSLNILNYYSGNIRGFNIVHQNTAIKVRSITNNNILARLFYGFFDTLRIFRDLKKNIKTDPPAIIHFTTSASIALWKDLKIARIASKKNIPTVIHFRFGRIPELAAKNNWEWKLLCGLIRTINTAIVIDDMSFITLNNLGFTNVIRIPNPVSSALETIAAKGSKTAEKRACGKVLFIGHVVFTKGIREFVEAVSQIPELKEILIIGPYEDDVKEQLVTLAASGINASHIKFTGNLSKEQIIRHLNDASVFVLPSYTEGFPNAVVEAMASGCPVVASAVGAIPEMLGINTDKPCGIMVPVKNVNALKDAISELLTDFNKARILGRNGMERVLEQYTLSSVCEQYERIWENAVKNK